MITPSSPRLYSEQTVAGGDGVQTGSSVRSWAVVASTTDGGRPAIVSFHQNRQRAEVARDTALAKTPLGMQAVWIVVQEVRIAT
jgi:hypothetical protein